MLRTLSYVFVLGMMLTPASGEVIYETGGPFGGPFGLIGFDVCAGQSVAVRFTPDADYTLDGISLWFMSNDFAGRIHPLVEVTLRTDGGGNVPSDDVLEAWEFNVSAVGWNPVLEVVDSESHPVLSAGTHYWVVTESMAECGLDGVWNWSASGTGFVATSLGYGQPWQEGSSGAVVGVIVEGSAGVPGDQDGDGDVDLADFQAYHACANGPLGEDCDVMDFDGDGDVDWADFRAFQLAFTGSAGLN